MGCMNPPSRKQDSLLCSLDRAFDNASVFIMKGESYRGRKLVPEWSIQPGPNNVCKHEKSRQTIGLAGLFYLMPV